MTAAALVDPSAAQPSHPDTDSFALFFYGTLVHPAILSRMIGHPGRALSVQPAILPGYALHHVRHEEYPGLVTLEQSRSFIGSAGPTVASGAAQVPAQPAPVTAVRGTVVHGLRKEDVKKLDAFEGDEYIRAAVEVLPDTTVAPLSNALRSHDQSIEEVLSSLTTERIHALLEDAPRGLQRCQVYLWHAPIDRLEPDIWTFETFMSSGKHHKWWSG